MIEGTLMLSEMEKRSENKYHFDSQSAEVATWSKDSQFL